MILCAHESLFLVHLLHLLHLFVEIGGDFEKREGGVGLFLGSSFATMVSENTISPVRIAPIPCFTFPDTLFYAKLKGLSEKLKGG